MQKTRKSIKVYKEKNKTRKHFLNAMKTKNMQQLEQVIIINFLHLLNTVKLYHWKTHSYATHKATDELYSKLNEHIDSFVEVMLGKTGNRVDLTHVHSISLCDYSSVEPFKREIQMAKDFLVGLDKNKLIDIPANSDLYNIRDEILSDLNQFSYLLTFQ